MEVKSIRLLPLLGSLALVVGLIVVCRSLSTSLIASPSQRAVSAVASSTTAVASTTTSTQDISVVSSTIPLTVIDNTPTSTVSVSSTSVVAHIPMPTEVRGFYWTGYTAGSKRVESLLAYAGTSHLNTVVIDLKLDNGDLSFVPKDSGLLSLVPKYPAIRDLDGLLERLRQQSIYRIARIFVMRDGAFGKLHPTLVLRNADGSIWRDNTRTPWLDPAAPEVADYSIVLAREAYARGFDEVQFDYVRFPSDGRLSDIKYPVYNASSTKVKVMKTLFERVGGALQAEGIPVSFDLFGLTFWGNDGLGIGQRLTDAYASSDAVSPMVYPSHYYSGFQGFVNPAKYPYEVVKRSLDKGIETLRLTDTGVDSKLALKKFRPWIQDFNFGAKYTAPMIEAQIKATRDAGASGWMLWNARNVYTKAMYY